MSHPEYSQEELDALALYSLGLLEGDECLNLDKHLRAGCTHCESHIMEFRKTAASFVEHAAPPAAPPITLRTRVLALTGISALSSSPDSNSESSHSRNALSPTRGESAPLENGSEPTPPITGKQLSAPRDSQTPSPEQ